MVVEIGGGSVAWYASTVKGVGELEMAMNETGRYLRLEGASKVQLNTGSFL